MAVDGYMYFKSYDTSDGNKGFLLSESQVDTKDQNSTLWKDQGNFEWTAAATPVSKDGQNYTCLFEIEDFSFDIEQTLNIGSQSTGAGAGKVTFNPFSITRKIDRSSPDFFRKACAGQPFKYVVLGLRKSSGGNTAGQLYLCFKFALVAVKTVSWAYDDESPKETITFEYGGLQVHYTPQKPDGSMASAYVDGWNRVKNIRAQDAKNMDIA